ncbi:GPI-anchored wall transfer protein [Balamuthia mandrillaris]
MDSYKQQKEQFVSGHEGGSALELALLLLVLPVSTLAHRVVASTMRQFSFVVDFALLVMPMLLVFTLPQHMLLIYAALAAVTFAFAAYSQLVLQKPLFQSSYKERNVKKTDDNTTTSAAHLEPLQQQRKPFLTYYRSGMMLATCICILAVDFPIFPRRFAKTESYGLSLMDIGVGCFVLSAALTYREGKERNGLLRCIYRALPLLILGFVRLAMVKGTDYQEHVSEYGVHWNFFFTLAFISFLASMLSLPVSYSALFGFALLTGYQFCLSNMGLREYILEHPRTNLFHQNKEGFCSSIGYLALYFIGAQLGNFVLRSEGRGRKEWRSVFQRLFLLSLLFWALALVAEHFIEPSSRRMVNATYVFYTLALNLQTLWPLLCLDLVLVSAPSSPTNLAAAINRNQLFFFLLCNLLVGVVNFGMKTIFASDTTALTVLTAYLLIASIVASVLHVYNITIKFW